MSEMDDLAAFAVLIEAGSFTLAAEQLGCGWGDAERLGNLLRNGLFCAWRGRRSFRRVGRRSLSWRVGRHHRINWNLCSVEEAVYH